MQRLLTFAHSLELHGLNISKKRPKICIHCGQNRMRKIHFLLKHFFFFWSYGRELSTDSGFLLTTK